MVLFDYYSWVDDEESVGSTGDGGVEPAVEIYAQCLGWDAAHIDEDVAPLAALRFVARDSIGEFHLQRVVVGVFLEFALAGGWRCRRVEGVGVVHNALIERLLFLGGKRCGFGEQGVEVKFAVEIYPVVGKMQINVGEERVITELGAVDAVDPLVVPP